MKACVTLPDVHERVRAILTACDLAIGFAVCLPGEPRVSLHGAGDDIDLTLPVARDLLDALRPVWGEGDAHVRQLASVIHALEGGE